MLDYLNLHFYAKEKIEGVALGAFGENRLGLRAALFQDPDHGDIIVFLRGHNKDLPRADGVELLGALEKNSKRRGHGDTPHQFPGREYTGNPGDTLGRSVKELTATTAGEQQRRLPG